MNVVGDDVLLIPIHIDALAAGTEWPSANLFQWTRLSPDYAALERDSFLLGPEPDFAGGPFLNAPSLPPGVHLHFRLPRAFIHGREVDGEPIAFPPIPNRWLVQRFGRQKDPHRAWLISSDLDAEDKDGLAWPEFPRDTLQPLTLRRIGHRRELSEKNPLAAEESPAKVKLTAVGPGDALFSAHYQASGRVLGFHDKTVLELPVAENSFTSLSYLVTGWFSSKEDDWLWLATEGLKGTKEERWAQLQPRLKEQGWACEPPGTASPPRRMLCHGLIRGISWRGQHVNYRRSIVGGVGGGDLFAFDSAQVTGKHRVALAETPAEALAALLLAGEAATHLGFSGEVARDLLSALQADLLDQPLTRERLWSELHARRFDSGGADTIWTIIAERDAAPGPQASTTPVPDDLASAPTVLPRPLARALEDLNAARARADAAARHAEACRHQLHTLWHLMTDALNHSKGDVDSLRGQFNAFRAALNQAETESRNAAAKCDAIYAEKDGKPTGTLAALLGPADATHPEAKRAEQRYRVVRSPARHFHSAAEPAIAISGPAVHRRNTGERAGTLRCRLAEQIVSAVPLSIAGGSQGTIQGDAIIGKVLGDKVLSELPKTLDRLHISLLAEAILFDTKDPPAKPVGTPPDRIAVFDRENLGEPWIPLVLDWEVTWTPNDATAGDGDLAPEVVYAHWMLTERGELAAPSADDPTRSTPMSGKAQKIRGRAFLLDHEAKALRDRLYALNQSHALLPDLAAAPIAVQTLAGFNPALLMRHMGIVLPAFDYERFIDPENQSNTRYLDPIQEQFAACRHAPRLVPGEGAFFPVREGTLRVNALNIVDSFGQTLKLPCPPGTLDLHLPPRQMHPARLNLGWGHETVPSAIAGWLVPNRLDKSLTVHDADGLALGILQKKLDQKAGTSDPHGFSWVGVPNNSGSLAAERDPDQPTEVIRDPDLRHFCQRILQLSPDDGAAFFRMLGEQVDASDQRVPEAEAALSLLVGRPLALARAEIRLESAGLPSHKPRLKPGATGTAAKDLIDTRGVERVKWPIRLGNGLARDDALVGFFTCGTAGAEGGLHPARGRAADDRDQFPSQDLTIDGTSTLRLVLLFDPQGRIHVTSGMLPNATFSLPPEAMAGRRGVREVFFQTAPVLGFGSVPEMPRLSDDFGEWSWTWRPTVTSWVPAPEQLVEAAERGGFTGRWPIISEGWLKLFIEPLRIVSFWAADATGAVPADSRVHLAWSVQGAERLELLRKDKDGKEETPVDTWDGPPFPSGVSVPVSRDATFRLKATGSGTTTDRSVTINVKPREGHT